MAILSVVIPTYNRLNSLKQVLIALEKQSYPYNNYEVVVVSDGSTDNTNDFIQHFHPKFEFHALVQNNSGVAAARNQGVNKSIGEIVLFLDDDVVPATNLLETHANAHEACPKSVIIGKMLTPKNYALSPWAWWEQEQLARQYYEIENGLWNPTPRQFYTGNASVRRKYILEAGGFNPLFLRAEDIELAYRLEKLGLEFKLRSDAIGYHYVERSYESWLKIADAYGKNDVIFGQDPDRKWIVPVIFQEYHQRHPITRVLVKASVGRDAAVKNIEKAIRPIGFLGFQLKKMNLSKWAFSLIFNLHYYYAVSQALGGRQNFFQHVEKYCP